MFGEWIDFVKWEYKYCCVRRPKIRKRLVTKKEQNLQIVENLQRTGFRVIQYRLDVDDYKNFVKAAEYEKYDYYHHGKAENFAEKSLEHYLSAKFLCLKPNDVFIDIANDYSPVPEIFQKLYGSIVYRQDIVFPAGINESKIGGNAASMPVREGFASKMALHCSFEHFERNDDINFIREINRVLFKGGKAVICPLYLSVEHAIQTNPLFVTRAETKTFDENVVIYCAKNWQNRHARYYDAHALDERIRKSCEGLDLTIYHVENSQEIDPSCYLRYLALIEKK